MLIVLLLRQGPHHIVNYYNNGVYRTICGESHSKNSKVNTISADNTFYGICGTCKRYFDDMHQSDLQNYPRDARSSQVATEDMVFLHRVNLIGPKAKYSDLMDYRYSSKLTKYRRLIHRDHVKTKTRK